MKATKQDSLIKDEKIERYNGYFTFVDIRSDVWSIDEKESQKENRRRKKCE